MKGQLHIIYPDKPVEVRMVSHPIDQIELENILGIGGIDVVSSWDHHLDFGGVMRRCLVLVNDDAPMIGRQFNLTATAIWQFIAKTKGEKHDKRLTGPVVVCMGDEEFLDNVLI